MTHCWDAPQVPTDPTGVQAKADAETFGGTDDLGTLPKAERFMLEIRQAKKGFIVFDTDEQAAIMRFDSHAAAADLIADLVIAEYGEQLKAWQSPGERQSFYLARRSI